MTIQYQKVVVRGKFISLQLSSKNKNLGTSGQDGGIGRHTVPTCTVQPKEGQQQFKNKKQPELTENRTVWKSNNKGVNDATFIQTSRRGGDGQPGRRELPARQRLEDPVR